MHEALRLVPPQHGASLCIHPWFAPGVGASQLKPGGILVMAAGVWYAVWLQTLTEHFLSGESAQRSGR